MTVQKISCLLLALLGSVALYAQVVTIKGHISSEGKGLSGVSVREKGSSRGTSSDAEGNFSISTAHGRTLVFTAVGYSQEEIPVRTDAVLHIEMKIAASALNEVVVTALGIRRNTRTLTYATQQIEGGQLTQARDATGSMVNSLSGKVAGLQVSQSANGPGGANRVILRGNRSITGNNNALFVVDGVAIDNSVFSDQSSSFGGKAPIDGASGINPDDIESVTVLKGAAAAALYGSRAANGVIIVTTKKGRAGKTAVNVNSGISVSRPMLLPHMQNEYGQGSGGTYVPNTELNWGPKMDGQQVTDWTGKQSAFTAQPDNVKDFFRNALTLNNSVGISSGSEKVQSYLSYSNNRIEGLLPSNNLTRHNLNAYVSTHLTKKLTIEGKVNYMIQDLDNDVSVGETLAPPISSIFQTPRNIRTADMKNFEHFDAAGNRVQNFWVPNSAVLQNPYFSLYRSQVRTNSRNRITALGVVRYELAAWLNAQVRVSLDRYTDRIDERTYQGVYWVPSSGGSTANGLYSIGSNYINERNVDFLLSGKLDLARNLSFNYNAGGQTLLRNGESRGTGTSALLKPEQFIITNAQSWSNQYSYYKRALHGLYATAQIGFKDYLFLDLSARNDWSSTLPASNRSYFYPAAGISGILSDMIKMPEWISFAKARFSYAQVGNDPPPYQLAQVYNSPTAGGLNGWMSPSSNKALGDLKPELTRSYELGLDWRFFSNRLGLDFTAYHTNTINQYIQISIPLASEFSTQSVNAGNISNEGLEFTLKGTPIQRRQFKWNVILNASTNRNKVIRLSPNLKTYIIGSDRLATSQVDEGGRIGDLYVLSWSTDPKTGAHLVDANGVPITTSAASMDIGNYNPKWNLGLVNAFEYHNWSFSFLVDGRLGGVLISGTDALLAFNGSADYTTAHRDGGWILPGTVQSTGNANTTAINAEKFWSTVGGKTPKGQFFAYDATNFRLREINFGYTLHLPPSIAAVIRSARIAVVGRNLFFIYRGASKLDIPGISKRRLPVDPDGANIGTTNMQGLEYMSLPTSRSLGLNLSLNF